MSRRVLRPEQSNCPLRFSWKRCVGLKNRRLGDSSTMVSGASRFGRWHFFPQEALGNGPREKALLFTPMALIKPHASLEAALAELFVSAGAEVQVVRCGKDFFGGCSVHLGESPDAREAICRACISSARSLDLGCRYEVSTIEQVILSSEQLDQIRALDSLSNGDLLKLSVEGFPVGKYLSYDHALYHKDAGVLRKAEYRSELRLAAKACLKAYYAADTKVKHFKPSIVVVYSNEYGVNRSFAAAARKWDVPVLNVHHTGSLPDRFTTFTASIDDFIDYPFTRPKFVEAMRLPLRMSEVVKLTEHFRSIYSSKSHIVYSRARGGLSALELRQQIGLRGGKVAVIAISSPDERLAAFEADLLPKELQLQDDLNEVREMLSLASDIPDVDFIFRLHPRLFPNRRDDVLSPDGARMVDLFRSAQSRSSNLFLSAPTDAHGLYDLALVADLVLTQRSSAAHEFAVLGIPAIYLDKFSDPAGYLGELNGSRLDHKTLTERVFAALDGGRAFDQAIAHLRYAATAYIRQGIHINRKQVTGPRSILKRAYENSVLRRYRASPLVRLRRGIESWSVDNRSVLGEGVLPSEAVLNWPYRVDYPNPSVPELSEPELLDIFLSHVRPSFAPVGSGAGVGFSDF